MLRGSLIIEQVLSLIAETPPRIAELTSGLAPNQLQARPNDEWSANDVLAHLRACAGLWGNCIAAIMAQDTPTLRACESPYLDQENELSRTEISVFVTRLC